MSNSQHRPGTAQACRNYLRDGGVDGNLPVNIQMTAELHTINGIRALHVIPWIPLSFCFSLSYIYILISLCKTNKHIKHVERFIYVYIHRSVYIYSILIYSSTIYWLLTKCTRKSIRDLSWYLNFPLECAISGCPAERDEALYDKSSPWLSGSDRNVIVLWIMCLHLPYLWKPA